MSAPVIQARGLRCSYGDFEAVRGVDLEVHDGELLALLGTNGAGKTTTVETLEGLRRPSAGQVRVLGRDPFRERAAVRRDAGIMLQSGGFAGELTVRETAQMWRGLCSRPSDVEESMQRLHLTHRADVRVSQLSGGERRRLDLLLATMTGPRLLFLDEPTTGLDPEARRGAWAVINDLRRAGTTVLLTTHYLEEAEQLADRVVLMHEGTVAVSGTMSEALASRPASVTFDRPAGMDPEHLPAMPSGSSAPVVDGERWTVRTTDLQDDLLHLLLWARDQGIRLERLRASSASLDEVFRAVADGEPAPERRRDDEGVAQP